MPKSTRTQIMETLEANLSKIKAGNLVPYLATGGQHRFLSTVRSVNRMMAALSAEKFPALYLVDPIESGRHMLADILQQTLELTVAGEIRTQSSTGSPLNISVEHLDNLIDDTRAVLVSDPTLSGFSRRVRIPRLEADTSTDDISLAFAATVEVDYIEVVDDGRGTTVQLPSAQSTYILFDSIRGNWDETPGNFDNPGAPYGGTVLQGVFNAFRSIPGLVWVERAKNWPLALEQISARYTPGIWFKETNERYEYTGSMDTKKFLTVAAMLVAVDTDQATFMASVDRWVGALKTCLSVYADLLGLVATVDLTSLRAERSEFPVVVLDLELQIMYVQSFAIS